jgi:predicted nucleic acid-binding protein
MYLKEIGYEFGDLIIVTRDKDYRQKHSMKVWKFHEQLRDY